MVDEEIAMQLAWLVYVRYLKTMKPSDLLPEKPRRMPSEEFRRRFIARVGAIADPYERTKFHVAEEERLHGELVAKMTVEERDHYTRSLASNIAEAKAEEKNRGEGN